MSMVSYFIIASLSLTFYYHRQNPDVLKLQLILLKNNVNEKAYIQVKLNQGPGWWLQGMKANDMRLDIALKNRVTKYI